jgi:hypothetical protein
LVAPATLGAAPATTEAVSEVKRALDEFNVSANNRLGGISERLKELDAAVGRIEAALATPDAPDPAIETGFAKVNERFATLSGDVSKLIEQMAVLRGEVDAQGKPVEGIAERVSALESRIEGLSKELAGASASDQSPKIRDGIDDVRKRVSILKNDVDSSVADLSAKARLSSILSGICCILVALLALMLVFRQKGAPAETARPQAAAPAASGAPRQYDAIESKLASISNSLSQIRAAMDTTAPSPAPAFDRLETRISSLEGLIRNLAAKPAPMPAPAPAPAAVPSKQADCLALLWPKSVRAMRDFSKWSETLAKAVEGNSPDACMMASAMMEFRAACEQGDIQLEQIAVAVKKYSLAVYNYCYSLDGGDGDDHLDFVKPLAEAAKEAVRRKFPSLDIVAFNPHDTLDTDKMERQGSGSTLSVRQPLSWLVRDKGAVRERVLHRAIVLTD